MESKRMKPVRRWLMCAMVALGAACSNNHPDQPSYPREEPPRKTTSALGYTLEAQYPHDVNAFTEGLLFHDGKLLESTGSPENLPETRSVFGVVDLKTGRISVKAEIDRSMFGEGISVIGDTLFQVTYQKQTGFMYDAKTFKKIGQFSYPNKEGWGLTTDGRHLIMSDGTYNLTWFDPQTMKVKKTVAVTKEGYAVDHVNELEWIDGFIYANVWMTNTIIKIDPATGVVVAEGDFSGLQSDARKQNPSLGEMNGIAYDAENKRVLLTGKMWPYYFAVKFGM